MKNKTGIFLCILLIISFTTPTIITVLAKRPDQTPPPLEKIVFIHHKKGHVKPPGVGKPNGDSGEYKLLGKGVKWKAETIALYIDSSNSGLTQSFVEEAVRIAAEEWDDGACSDWGGVEIDLVDEYHTMSGATFDEDSPDGKNEILFGWEEPGTIAVTIIWGYFGGPPKTREIIEFDILFNTYYAWGDAETEENVIDLQNIATHEIGHGLGLADLYDTDAAEETMYGYADYEEMNKRSLYKGDIAGITALYG